MIHDLPIENVIGREIKLQQAGSILKAPCPFHQENTPSFVVYPKTNTYKCFGCGESGDAIRFIQKKKGFDFIETLRAICKDHGIPFNLDKKEIDPEVIRRRQSLIEINRIASAWFQENLFKPENSHALEYISSRFSEEIIKSWGIGYAPKSYNQLMNHLLSRNVALDDIKAAGLITIAKDQVVDRMLSKTTHESTGKDQVYDRFRDRIIFPVTDQRGEPIAFMGRVINPNDKPKYLNTSDTEIFSKGKMLFGLSTALAEIRKTGKAYLVEGNPDVIRLQSHGVLNTICTMGTSLTREQALWIKKYANAVSLIYDQDKAGLRATDHSADICIKDAELFVNVIPLESDDGSKVDPDSFFTSKNHFLEYEADKAIDFIEYYVQRRSASGLAFDKQSVIKYLCELISIYPTSTRELYIDKVSEYIKPKKAWTDELKQLDKDADTKEMAEIIPKHVNANLFERYGFYEDKNQYYFRTKSGIIRGCNFVMRPLFHVQSVINSKRLYEIVNEYDVRFTIELAQKDMISLQAFRLRIESMGNFLFEASEVELNKLKRFLYEKTESCIEITQLGWQKQGFWAWGNGIYNSDFNKATGFGIVKHNDDNFYIPAYSSIYAGEPSLFQFERKFIHQPGKITWSEMSKKLTSLFQENAWIGMAFLFATLHRDIIANRFGFFPILNLFGPKGTGKTTMAVIFLYFFGKANKGPNILNTSKAALADHVSQVRNALVHIDEYKNSIEYEKIEYLKGVWDGTGRTRMNMDKDKKKETTAVDSGVMLTGQEMPTADIALFSRLIFLTFTKNTFTPQERQEFDDFEHICKAGITHLTHEIIAMRDYFNTNYFTVYEETETRINQILGDTPVEDRVLRNWCIVFAALITVKKVIRLEVDSEKFLRTGVDLMVRQNRETKKTNDVSNFWAIFSFLVKEGELKEDVDFVVKEKSTETTDKGSFEFSTLLHVLYLQHTRVFQKYLRHGNMTKGNVLPIKTLEYYLANSQEYLGKKASFGFKMTASDENSGPFDSSKVKRNITSAMVFNYDRLKSEYEISVTTTDYDLSSDDQNEKPPF